MVSSLGFFFLAASVSAYTLPGAHSAPRGIAPRTSTAMAVLLPDSLPLTLLAEIQDTTGERVYGAVDAPGWVIPVGGLLAILTALLPVLLAPGEQAFNRQQEDETEVKNIFGRGRRD